MLSPLRTCLALVGLMALAPSPACNGSKTRTKTGDPPPIVAEPTPPPPTTDADAPVDPGPPAPQLVAVPEAVAAAVTLERLDARFARPVALEHAPGDRARLFVVEQAGLIKILRGGAVDPAPFLDVRREVSRGHEEQGLLGLAFHPEHATNGRLFINYTDRRGNTRVVEYRVKRGDGAADRDRVDPASAKLWLEIEQPWANHNGGGIEFGPDGKLYIGTGDGGAANDPRGAGQDRRSLLGKMLRLDVDGSPGGSPGGSGGGSRAGDGARPVIVQLGLRNPWRFHFDRQTGDLYIGDVGQDTWEWVNVAAAGRIDGVNWGWNVTEGSRCFAGKRCDPSAFAAPAIEYDHKTGCSITGGEVYRGKAIPEIAGHYFYADYCTAIVRSFRWSDGAVRAHWDWKPVLDPRFRLATLSSFGSDADGELYLLSLDGAVYKIVRQSRSR